MQILILAGGFGSRLMPVVNDRPKIMAPIHGKPFLELVIDHMKRQNITNIILALGYLSEYIKNYFQDGKSLGVKIKYSIEDMPLGTGGAIKNAEKLLDENFLVLNGDTYLDINYKNLEKYHLGQQGDITIVLSKSNGISSRGVVNIDNKFKVVTFREVENHKRFSNSYTNAGVYIMNKKICKLIKSGEKVSLEKEVLPKIINKLKIYGYVTKKEYLDIGTPERYHAAQNLLKKL